MEDKNVDAHLNQHLSGDPPRETFRQEALRDSMASFVRNHRRRSARRRAGLAVAAVLIAGIAFFSGRLSAPPPLPGNVDIASQAAAESKDVAVPGELLEWLDAARLFGRLGMQDRMARAVERASKLAPIEMITSDHRSGQVFAGDGFVENPKEHMELMDKSGSPLPGNSINQILAQSLGE